MAYLQKNKVIEIESRDQSWKELYIIGSISCIIFVVLILVAVIAYFFWPYTPGDTSVENIFRTLHDTRISGLISLDLLMVVGEIVAIPIELSLYVALKKVNESYALIALIIALMSIALCFQARPIAEIVNLSDQYSAATTDLARSQYLLAGESLITTFNGTAWVLYTIFASISGLIYSFLMLRSDVFSKLTAYTGMIISIAGVGVFIPVIGIAISLLATIGGVLWFAVIGHELLRVVRQKPLPAMEYGG